MSLTTGEIIEGKYRIVRLIGEGGMGAVYEGENTRIHRRVAIKVLHQGVAENQEAVQRFEREAQAAGRIGNDHILEVLDLGELPNGDRYMVMEYLDGEPLSERIRTVGRMRPEEVAQLMIQVLAGLKAAHDAGIVHRDLKPDNVFVLKEKAGKRDFVKLIDFGISKFQPLSGSEMKMTRTGTVMGTPYYMSPEQASGSRDADHRSDLYAVGVMLYEAVVGRVPFDAPTFNQLLFQIVLSDPAPPQELVPDLDPAFANLIAKAMARDAEHRFQSASELSDALTSWLKTGASVSVRPASPINPLIGRAAMASAPKLAAVNSKTSANGFATPESWSNRGVEAEQISATRPHRTRLFVGLGIGGLLLMIAGVIAVRLFTADHHVPPVASTQTIAAAPEASTGGSVPTVVPVAPDSVAATNSLGASPTASVRAEPSDTSPTNAPSTVAAPNKPTNINNTAASITAGARPTAKAQQPSPGQKSTKPKAAPRNQQAPVDFGY